MRKLLMVGLVLFIAAMVLPELRPLLLVGAFCWFGGFVVGTQHTAKHTAALQANRLVRQLEA